MERRKPFCRAVTIYSLILALGTVAQAQYAGGSGTLEDPYLITTPEQMNAIGADPNDWDKHFKLMADIDLGGYTADQFNRIGYYDPYRSWLDTRAKPLPFTGVFDGNGHTISNFSYNSREYERGPLALFCYVDDPNAQIKNLGLVDPNVGLGMGEYECTGALVGWLVNGTVTNCYATGVRVVGYDGVGGLVGYNEGGTLANCHVSGIVTGTYCVGGLVGNKGLEDPDDPLESKAAITGCHANATVTGRTSIGGLLGYNATGDIEECQASGTVTGTYGIGGLVGDNGVDDPDRKNATITDCHADATVTGQAGIGGLVGRNFASLVVCHSSGMVVGANEVGGLAGQSVYGSLSGCRSVASVTGVNRIGGLVGINFGDVADCYASGSVIGEKLVGGLLGSNYTPFNAVRRRGDHDEPAFVQCYNCYAVGTVEGTGDVGGLIGYSTGGVIQCFWDVETSGQTVSAEGTGGTTAQMRTADTFSSWATPENEGTWTIDDGNDYPRLWWEDQPGEAIEAPSLVGAGTPSAPFLIGTAQELACVAPLASEWGQHFRLVADIDLLEYEGILGVIGTEDAPFTGVFDGNGHIIANLQSAHIADFSNVLSAGRGAGLFGYVDDPNALITNLGLMDPYIDAPGESYVGALVRVLDSGTVSGCFAKGGTVRGRRAVGGLVGDNHGVMMQCYAATTVVGENRVAGLAGYNSAVILNCYATGRVEGAEYSGGLIGEAATRRGSVPGMVTAAFWDIETSGSATSDGGTGLSTAEMQTAAAFLAAGWDFVGEDENGVEDLWWIDEGSDYPRLWWERAEAGI